MRALTILTFLLTLTVCAFSIAGQRFFASAKLLQQKGIDTTDGAQAEPWSQADFLLSLDDICAAFWTTEHGLAMRDQLDNYPFDKCARVSRFLG